uniref:Borealin N-terminal domain-containing protein n=1 Tax=Mycena chlorophos TaxID=658473 RepID=A0ABQ0M658_MYCCL|nr:predicted protein [Mycena chlorophos]
MFTDDEKHHLIANLHIEVDHRKTQLEAWLADHLERFTIHQEGLVLRIPKQVRAMKMRDFGAKYNGSLQAALRGVQRERLAAAGATATEIDKSTRKRKWVASQEAENDASTSSEKSSKTARLASPDKKPVPPRVRVLSQTVGNNNKPQPRPFGSPSPQKTRPPFTTATRSPRPMSPSKFKPTSANPAPRSRVPSVATFNPAVPKTPAYPTGSLRMPRKHESMFSLNGSPIANPHDVWPDQQPTLKRSKSTILIQRDPSFTDDTRSRSTSQSSSSHQPSSSSTSLFDGPATHPPNLHERTKSEVKFKQFKFPVAPEPTPPITPAAARRPLVHVRSQSTLPITLSTTDGHVLSFDALQASPGQLDALEGISDSAKKQARQEMRILVQAAVDKWTM